MKILIVSSYLPFPLHSGGHIRLFNLIKHLSKNHEITLICEKRDFQTNEDVKAVEAICEKVITVKRNKQWTLANILKTGFSKEPFLTVGHTGEEFKQAIKDELVREEYDLIHVETFYVFQNLPARQASAGIAGGPKVNIPVVLIEHNIEYLVYKRFAKLSRAILKPLYYIDVFKLEKAEKLAWNRATKLVAVSNSEKVIMKREDVDVVPNGVDTSAFAFRDFVSIPEEKRILFIGDFKWLQNKDALEFILKDIWPKLILGLKEEKLKDDVKLWIVGKNIPENLKLRAKNYENVIFDENNKEETPVIFRKAYALLAPLRAAGGTSYKILEAMSTGVPVVTTDLSIEGLEAKNEMHVLTAGSAEDFAGKVLSLFKDKSLYHKLALNGRKLVEEKYDWERIAAKLNEVYASCI
jgi:polysaccharide biosynthesis protein PslH